MRIWKYQFDIADKVTIQMAVGAEILSVQMQDGVPTIWALCDPSAAIDNREFRVYGTGHLCHSSASKFIGTLQLQNGLVFHVFTG